MEEDVIQEYEQRISELERKINYLSYLEMDMIVLKKQVKKNKGAITFFKISILISMFLLPIFAILYVLRLLSLMEL